MELKFLLPERKKRLDPLDDGASLPRKVTEAA
jgi:hypothetical protein